MNIDQARTEGYLFPWHVGNAPFSKKMRWKSDDPFEQTWSQLLYRMEFETATPLRVLCAEYKTDERFAVRIWTRWNKWRQGKPMIAVFDPLALLREQNRADMNIITDSAAPEKYEAAVLTKMRNAGFRITTQRLLIIRAIAAAKQPIKQTEINTLIAEAGEKAHANTTSRIIQDMVKEGLVIQSQGGYLPVHAEDPSMTLVHLSADGAQVIPLPGDVRDVLHKYFGGKSPLSVRVEINHG
jgi:hypothetical protein